MVLASYVFSETVESMDGGLDFMGGDAEVDS